jgi:WD40 repeat protein
MHISAQIIANCMKRWFTAIFLLGLVAGLSGQTTAQTGEPSGEPVLRIETGMHTAPIQRIGIDSAGLYLATASDDKTVRVWEMATGRLLRILRPPIGDGNEGKLRAIAMSPDGRTIAVSGWVGYEWDKSFAVYIFDRASGRLVRRITDLPSDVCHLVYSRDGRYLAATFPSNMGLRVYEAGSYVQTAEDHSDYSGDSYGADFDVNRRLATVSYDGFIRLYQVTDNGALRRLGKKRSEGGTRPFSVSFNPEGDRIAIGFTDVRQVEVADDALRHLFTPDSTGLNGDVALVTWSADGRTLYAGGSHNDSALKKLIRAWADMGQGGYRDIPTQAGNTILHILPFREGGIVYGTADPGFGVINRGGQVTQFTHPAILDFRDTTQELLLSREGETVQFKDREQTRAIFSIPQRTVDEHALASSDLDAPRVTSTTLIVSDWNNSYNPKSNGRTLQLERFDMSRSLAIAPSNQQFLLGTEFSLQLFNSDGSQRWKVFSPSATWGVNISGNGNLAVAAYGDGTIRWYRMTDGKELLVFFLHADRKRWVLWTPSGYYDASPGAEEIIGWHVNNGKDQAADFFPVGQFRATYYRPDVISKVLKTGDEARALQLANEERGRKAQTATVGQMLPPVVDIASPADNSAVSSSEVAIRYSLRTPSGETVTNVRALVDGRPVTGNRQLTREDASTSGMRELKLSVPEHDSEVSIIAENRFAASVPATIRLKWRGSAPTTEAFVIRPKLYVLAIGVSQYLNPAYSLKFAAKDARDFAAAAATQKGFLYRDVIVKVLTDDQATKDNVLDGLDWIRKETTSKDVAMVFFAGHGLNDQNGVYYFLPYNTDLEKLLRTGVPFTDIKNTVQSLAGKTLFFIDTCHSGNVLGGRRGLADDLNGIINELSSAESGAVVFAASTGSQYSLEDVKWNNGAFTKALVEGITGRADYTGKGRITINMLDLYLSERVKELTSGKQTPTTAKPNTIQDFPIAVKH